MIISQWSSNVWVSDEFCKWLDFYFCLTSVTKEWENSLVLSLIFSLTKTANDLMYSDLPYNRSSRIIKFGNGEKKRRLLMLLSFLCSAIRSEKKRIGWKAEKKEEKITANTFWRCSISERERKRSSLLLNLVADDDQQWWELVCFYIILS